MAFLSSPPINTLSGSSISFIADPSAKNSGFDNTWNFLLFGYESSSFLVESKIFFIVDAVFTGKVLFSTTIVSPLAYLEISLADLSIHLRSIAKPAPRPFVLVGVFTEIKIISAFEIFSFMLFEKNKLIPLHFYGI